MCMEGRGLKCVHERKGVKVRAGKEGGLKCVHGRKGVKVRACKSGGRLIRDDEN